jgi:hypothetical protein
MHVRWLAIVLLSISALTAWGCGSSRHYRHRPVYGPVYGTNRGVYMPRGQVYRWERERREREELRRLQRRHERLRRLERQRERMRERYYDRRFQRRY